MIYFLIRKSRNILTNNTLYLMDEKLRKMRNKEDIVQVASLIQENEKLV